MTFLDREIQEIAEWMAAERFSEITRLFSARQVAEQRGTIPHDHTVARLAALCEARTDEAEQCSRACHVWISPNG